MSRAQDEERRDGGAVQQRIQETPMEIASSEDRRHTLAGVFVTIDSNLGSVIGKEEGARLSLSQATKEELLKHW